MEFGAKRIGLSGGLVLVLLAGVADAATKSVTVTKSGPGAVTMARFDPALGKLVSVDATVTYNSIVPYLTATTPVGSNQAVTGWASLGTLTFALTGSGALAQQPGYYTYLVTASGSATWTNPTDLAGLFGNAGALAGNIDVSAQSPGSPIPGSFLPSATYTVTYTYDDAPAVPEPATWAMMVGGFVLTGVALRAARRGRAVAKRGEA